MAVLKLFAIGAAGIGALVLIAAQHPSALAGVQGGLWEISGAPGAKSPIKECVARVASLAEFEHRGKGCTMKVVRDQGSSAVVEYSCGKAGFGRSEVNVLTPRSLRIDTQGIADQLPFGYVLQARRIGECPAPATASGH
jgi:hypothetical protein